MSPADVLIQSTCGDDSIAIKGTSSNMAIKNLVVRGGNGVAFGSLGQYVQFVSTPQKRAHLPTHARHRHRTIWSKTCS